MNSTFSPFFLIGGTQENLAKSAVQTIIRVVLTGDEDRSFCIEENEVKKTALKVYIELEAQNIEIRLKEFQNAIRAQRPILYIMIQCKGIVVMMVPLIVAKKYGCY